MKIAFFEVEDWEAPVIRELLAGYTLKFFKEKLTAENVKEVADFDVVSVFIYSKVDENILKAMPNLKLITTRSTGFDHIDLKACRAKKVNVCNVPTYGANTVAEHAFAMILAISRKIIESVNRTKKGSFELEGLRGFDLKGKTMGVVGGCGNIGRHVVRIAHGFEMNILVFDVKKDEKFAKEMGFKFVDVDTLLRNSDIITLHVPLIPATKYMINVGNISKIKKGAVLINTSRGGLIETEALIKGLDEGIISYAGLDVLEEECAMKEERELLTKEFSKACDLKKVLEQHILIENPKVIITPHNAFNSQEALMRILETTIENIKGFAAGKVVNLVKV
ncbi:hydroxyacid dehydrogenase [Candidatus Woesearchaeota archaeon]|nr:hydroxyacid dehydrogenase [Candidatus Woesearchaeota archaeon]